MLPLMQVILLNCSSRIDRRGGREERWREIMAGEVLKNTALLLFLFL
jgi:hypothetical protein